MDWLNSRGMDRLKTSFKVHTVCYWWAIRVPFPTRLLPKNGKMKENIEGLDTHTNLLSKCKHRWKSIEQIGSTTQRMDTDNVTTHIVKVHFQFENWWETECVNNKPNIRVSGAHNHEMRGVCVVGTYTLSKLATSSFCLFNLDIFPSHNSVYPIYLSRSVV